MDFVNISDSLADREKQIENFLSGLDNEKRYFGNKCAKSIMKSTLVVAAIEDDQIVGLTYLKKRYFFFKSYTVVKEAYQQFGTGAFLSLYRDREAKDNFSLILSQIHPDNHVSREIIQQLDGRLVGRRFGWEYYLNPMNVQGRYLAFVYKVALTFVTLWDRIKGRIARMF